MCRVGRERLFTCRTQIDFVKVMWWEEKLAIALDVVVVGSVVAANTSMHVIILIPTYAITQQIHSCSARLRRDDSTATRHPQCGGRQATGRVRLKAVVAW